MKIDAHAHGIHAELNDKGIRVPPLVPGWKKTDGDPMAHVKEHNKRGIEKVLLLDPPEITFELKRLFGDFVMPCPMVDMDNCTPADIAAFLDRGACGIKFIAPMHPYSDDRYLPLYEVVRDCRALAVFHTGYLSHGNFFGPGCMLPRPNWINMFDMRPGELDRINRALPDLKILMAHFGNPWWDEAWTMLMSNKNIYADLSGGTNYKKSMNMWKEMFAPNGKLDEKIVSKLCYGCDGSMFHAGVFDYQSHLSFYENLYAALKLPDEIRRKIDGENILMLVDRKQGTTRH